MHLIHICNNLPNKRRLHYKAFRRYKHFVFDTEHRVWGGLNILYRLALRNPPAQRLTRFEGPDLSGHWCFCSYHQNRHSYMLQLIKQERYIIILFLNFSFF